jgi:hypothetical protein
MRGDFMTVRKTRNDTTFFYCLLDPDVKEAILDEDGNETGETILHYEEAVEYSANISPATGQAQTEYFGTIDNYDKVIFTRDTDCPIDENTVLFVEKAPEYTEIQTHEIIEGNALFADDEVVTVTYRQPKFDYIVKRVAKSLNGVLIAISKVKVS